MVEIKLKVMEALQEEAYKGIVRIDSETMKEIGVHPGDVVEIEGSRVTVGVVDRAYPTDVGQSVIRMDGIIRRNAKTGIGENVKVKKADVKEAKSITIAPAQKNVMIRANPDIFKKSLLGRAAIKGDIVVPGGARLRRKSMSESPFFDDVFSPFEDSFMSGFGLGNIRFIVVSTNPKEAVIITENTLLTLNPKAVDETEEKIPEVTYEDIGGLKEEITKIREMVELPLKHPDLFRKLGIEPPAGVLLHGPPGTGKTLLAKAVANESEANFILVNGPEIVNKFYGQSEENIRKQFEKAEKNAPSIIFFDEFDAIASKREESYGELERRVVSQLLTQMDGLKSRGRVVVIAATNRVNSIDPALRRPGRFDREICINVPNKEGRLNILKIHTRNMPLTKDVSLNKLSEITYGFVGADLSALCKEAAMNVLRRILPDLKLGEKTQIPEEIYGKLKITQKDFDQALRLVRPSALREVLIEKPNVKWEDVGGLTKLKQELIEAIEWPLKHSSAFKRIGIKPPSGLLLYGPPGTGKTLLAKAVASESDANFILVRGPELLNKFVGESEKGVRKVFERARQSAPTIIFFDEIDSLTPKRGLSSDSQVTERVVNTMLSEMDGLEELNDVVVIAASVTGDTPILIKDKVGTKLLPIKNFVDQYYEEGEEGIEKPVENVDSLGFDPLNTKINNGLRFSNSAFKKIRSVFRHKVDKIYEIEYFGGKLRTTGNHSVFIRTKKGIEARPVSTLKEGDFLVDLPYKVRSNNKFSNLRHHNFKKEFNLKLAVYSENKELKKNYNFILSEKNISQNKLSKLTGFSQATISQWKRGVCVPRGLSLLYFKHELPKQVKVTPELMKLLGYYTAEGYARKEIDFCFNINENHYITDLQNLMKNIFKLKPDAIKYITNNAVNIVYHSKPLADFFIRYCGKGAKNKHIPGFLFEAPKEYFLEYLKGYVAGDGHITKGGGIELTSVSKQIILELNWVCRMHGIKSYTSEFTVKAGRKINNQIINKETIAYRLGISKHNNPFINKIKDVNYSKRAKIKSINVIPYNDYVYDLCGCENEAFFGGESPVLLHNTNRPDIMDSALLRPGRFDRFLLTVPPIEEGRLEIFKIHTKSMPLDKDVDLNKLAKETEGYVGADIQLVCREAGLLALREDFKTKTVKNNFFLEALKKVKPSVSKDVMEEYQKLEEDYLSKTKAGLGKDIPNYMG